MSHLGSIRMTVNSAGAVVGYDDYYPFGKIMPNRSYVSSADYRFRFTSKERDVETGYDYFGARYYDSRIGRWLSVDPLTDMYPGWSPYNYVANNPLKYIDVHGDSLEAVTLNNNQEIYVDKKISDAVMKLNNWARDIGIPFKVNDDFRTTKVQKEIKEKYAKEKPDVKVAEPGTSRHESGFALDIQTVKWTKEQKTKFENKADQLGIMSNQVSKEPWHYQADPKKHGYKNRKAAIKENQKHYKELIKKEID